MSPKKRRAYVVAIGLGGVALLVDRLILVPGTMDPVEAIASTETDKTVGSPSLPAAPPAAADVPELPFPRIPASHLGQILGRDPFLPPSVPENPGVETVADNSSPPGRKTDRLSRAAFAERYVLNGVLVQESLRIAIVDGRSIRIGESVGGCELVEVTGNEARFRCEDGTVALDVISPGTSPRR